MHLVVYILKEKCVLSALTFVIASTYYQADESKGDVNNQFLRESLGSLTKGFTVVAKDRTPVSDPSSKKLAIFAVTNVLFKVYFKVNTLQLCGKLINVVEGPGGIMDNLRLFPVSDVVMYKYYIGRLKMFEDKYEEARYDMTSIPSPPNSYT
jgi:COP9 signalosome complex subunit 12